MKNFALSCQKVFLSGLILSVFFLFKPISVYSENEPNNSIETANALNINGSISGAFSNEDYTQDYFKIVAPGDGKLTVQVTSDAGLCVSLYILSETGLYTLAYNGSCGSENYSNSITINNLAAGTYNIEASNSGYGNYTISTAFEPASLPNDNGTDDLESALILNPNSEMTGHLGYGIGSVNADYYDYHKITTTSDGALTLNLTTDKTLCIDLNIVNETNTYALYSNGYCSSPNHSDKLVVNNLAAGTYIIVSSAAIGYGSYRISNTFIPASLANDIEPNDDMASAVIFNLNSTETGHLGYRNVLTDDYDFYRITTTANGKLKFKVLPDTSLCINLYLMSGDGKFNLTNSGYCGNENHQDSVVADNLPAGDYLLQASAVGYGSYQITSSFGFASGAAMLNQGDFTIFPNPVRNELFLSGSMLSKSTYKICDLAGKTVQKGLLTSGDQPYRIELSGFRKGMYIIELSNEKMTTQRKFNVE